MSAPAGDDVVVALDASRELAETVAATLGRPVLAAGGPRALVAVIETTPASSLLIVPGPQFTVADAKAVADASTAAGRPVGLVASWAGDDAVGRQLEKLGAYRPAGTDEDLVFVQFGFAPLASTGGGRLRLAAGTEAGVAGRLQEPHRLLAVASYGSAVDAEIGDAYVCALAGNDAGGAGPRRLPCHLGGLCLERHRATGAPEPFARVSPGCVVADCVIWGICSAVGLAGSVVDARDSVVRQFLCSRWCRHVLAPYKAMEVDLPSLLLATGLARAGATLGEMALALNRSSLHAKHHDAPWLLIGDPAGRLPGAGAGEPVRAIDGDAVADVTLTAGEIALLRSEREVAAVTGECDEPAAALSRRLLVRPVPGTGHVIACLASGAPVSLRLRAQPLDGLPAELRQALSIWTRPGSYAGLRRQLEAAAKLVDQRYRPGIDDLVVQLATRARSVGPQLPAGTVLSGPGWPSSSLADRCNAERQRWRTLHLDALEYLRRLTERSPATPGFLHKMAAPAPGWQAGDEPCPYCGMPVEEARYRVDDSALLRSRVQCLRCGLISDAPAAIGVPRLECAAAVAPGRGLQWSLQVPDQDGEWAYYAATMTFERVPWTVVEEASVAAGWHQRGDAAGVLSGTLTVRPDVPDGLYSCLAIAVAHGEPCFARRFVQVGGLGVAPRGGDR